MTTPTEARLTLSYSQITEYRKCPAAWTYAYVRGLTRAASAAPPIERDLGSWWHAYRAAASLDLGRRLGSLLDGWTPADLKTPAGDIPTDHPHLSAEVTAACEEWWVRLPGGYRDAFLEKYGTDAPAHLDHLRGGYARRWGEDGREPLGVEIKWEKELREGVCLRGFADEVYRDTERGLIVVADHKTHYTMPTPSPIDTLMDSQLHFYAWGLAGDLDARGMSVDAVEYDRVRVKPPSTPALTKSGKLSKAVTDYDLQTYLDWVGEGRQFEGLKKDGSGSGTYRAEEAVVESLGAPAEAARWFYRDRSPFNPRVVMAHLSAAAQAADDITRTRKETTTPPSRSMTMLCKWCDFASICSTELLRGPVDDENLIDHGLERRW